MYYRSGLGWVTAVAQGAAMAFGKYKEGTAGGDRCWTGYNKKIGTPCPNTPDYDAVLRAVEAAPQPAIDEIVAVLLATNSGRGPKSRRQLLKPECVANWVRAMMGGGDCRAKQVPEQPQILYDLVERYGAPKKLSDLTPGSAIQHAAELAAKPQAGALVAAAALAAIFLFPAIRGGK